MSLPDLLLEQLDVAHAVEMEPYTVAWQNKRFFVKVQIHSSVGLMGEHRLEFGEASVLIRVLREHRFVTVKVDETGLRYERLTVNQV